MFLFYIDHENGNQSKACFTPASYSTHYTTFLLAGKLRKLFGSDLPAFVDLALDHRALVEGFRVAHFSENFHALDYPFSRDTRRKKEKAKPYRQVMLALGCLNCCPSHLQSSTMRAQ